MLVLRPFQTEALDILQTPGHLICIAPTGSGKSLIYERYAVTNRCRILLISPLVALARQQASRLTEAGIKTYLGAGGGSPEYATQPSLSVTEKSEAWIVSPEMLTFPRHRERLRGWHPDLLVVDECHCLWEWGEDFRPAFAGLPALIPDFAIPRSLWLTATLPVSAHEQLREKLPESTRTLGHFALPDGVFLECRRVAWPERPAQLVRTVREIPGSGIVFAGTRVSTERLSRLLLGAGRHPVFYHAGMSREERRAIERLVLRRECDVVIATSAFGMGMDIPHLRWAIQWQAPLSLLALAQSIGRVGRNGAEGKAVIFWDDDDFRLLDRITDRSERRREELRLTRGFLVSVGCRKAGLARYFQKEDHAEPVRCGGCDFCEFT